MTVVAKEHGKVGDLLACYMGGFLVWWSFFLLFLADLHVLSDMVLNILKSYTAKMVLGNPLEFSMCLA